MKGALEFDADKKLRIPLNSRRKLPILKLIDESGISYTKVLY